MSGEEGFLKKEGRMPPQFSIVPRDCVHEILRAYRVARFEPMKIGQGWTEDEI